MIRANGSVLRRMLSQLKSQKGCTLEELVDAIPDIFRNVDVEPTCNAYEAITTLIKWGLVEAYFGGKLVNDWFARVNVYSRLKWSSVTFFIGPHALEIEEILGVRLDSSGQRFFGHPGYGGPSPSVFVLMPFVDSHRVVYDHISRVASSFGHTVARGDDLFTTGSVMSEIWSAINHASIIIADCTGRNPNVFYEIGIAHAIGKATLLIAQSIDDIPFDLRHLRVLQYDPSDMNLFEEQLTKTVTRIREGPSVGG